MDRTFDGTASAQAGLAAPCSARPLRYGLRPGQVFYFRDRTREVDFLIHRAGRFELYDAKWTEQPDTTDLRSLERVSSDLGEKLILRRGVICRAPNAYPLGERAQALALATA